MPEKESALEEAGAMDAVLVNTHKVSFPSLLFILVDYRELCDLISLSSLCFMFNLRLFKDKRYKFSAD